MGANSQQAHDIRFLINQCQIITFLILKYHIILENSRIELKGTVLPVQVGGLLGGGPKGMLPPPPLKLLGDPGAWPPWPPFSYAYVSRLNAGLLI